MGVVGLESNPLMDNKFLFGITEEFWRERIVMAAQHCKLLNATESYTLKWLKA